MADTITRFQWFIARSGKTQTRIGQELGLTQPQISKLARGKLFPGRETNALMKKISGGALHAGNCHDPVDPETGQPVPREVTS